MEPITIGLLCAGYAITCFVGGAAGGLLVDWIVGFLKALWGCYPKIKEGIDNFLNRVKTEVRVVIDLIDNRLYRIRSTGIDQNNHLEIITDKNVSVAEMEQMGYKGGNRFEHTLKLAQ